MIGWKEKRAYLIRKGKIEKKENQPKVSNTLTEFAIEVTSNLIDNATSDELAFCEFLKRKNIEFNFQYPVIINSKLSIIDFYFPKLNIGIEIDGYYHYTKQGMKKDYERTRRLSKSDIWIIRISNHDMKKFIKVFYLLTTYRIL